MQSIVCYSDINLWQQSADHVTRDNWSHDLRSHPLTTSCLEQYEHLAKFHKPNKII